MSKRVEFLAVIPPHKNALRISGDDGGAVSLEVPETSVDALVELRKLRRRVVKVTIEDMPQPRTKKQFDQPEWGEDDDEAENAGGDS